MIVGMNHFTIVAEDEKRTLEFYVDVLGLRVGDRPDLGFPGAWLYGTGPQAVLHMYFDRPMPSQRSGVIDHMAFTATDLRAVKARFDAAEVKYDLPSRPARALAAFYTRTRRSSRLPTLRSS